MENMEKVVYLDNAATTPCAPEALELMVKALSGACGNPSSHYSIGYEAKEFVDTGRAQVAKAINAYGIRIDFLYPEYRSLGYSYIDRVGA